MPSEYDEMTERSHIIINALTRKRAASRPASSRDGTEGFHVYEPYWWHYDYRTGRVSILDISFDKIKRDRK